MTNHPIIDALKPSIMNFDLGRMRAVMEKLNQPHNAFPSVHVAGTNGKGSVTSMIAGALRETGLKVGMYTSPHLTHINERFQINGRMISDAALHRHARTLIKKFPHLTQFEFLTTIAFQWFAEQKIDVAVIEVGLGGRLDATNVLRRVLASVITNIDFDHMNWLGGTIGDIAIEKAGIIKPGVPVITGASGAALRVITAVAMRSHAPLIKAGPAVQGMLAMEGEHQRKNAAIAIQALNVLRARVPGLKIKNIFSGVRHARWPGRFERILLGSGAVKQTVILDGAHNPAGCRVLAQTLRKKKCSPVNLLFGVLKDKDIHTMTHILSPLTDRIVTVPVPSERSADPVTVARLPAWRGRAVAAASISSGWKNISGQGNRPIVVAGSLYLVGKVREMIQ